MTSNIHDAFDSIAEADGANTFGKIPSGRAPHVFTSQLVADAEARVAESGVLDKLTTWRGDDNHTTGVTERPIIVSDRAILVGLLLLASDHSPLMISSLAEVFQYRLTSDSRILLGLTGASDEVADHARDHKRWYRKTRTAFNRMLAVMDPYPQDRRRALTYAEVQAVLDAHDPERSKMMKARLDEFTNRFLRMTFNQQPRRLRDATSRIDLSIGQLCIASPTSKGFSRKTLAKKAAAEIDFDPRAVPSEPVDVDAGWFVRGRKNDQNDFAWGWTANIAVRVDSEHFNEARFPELAISATLTMPGASVSDEAVSLMRAALNSTGLSAGAADADYAYFANSLVQSRSVLFEKADDMRLRHVADYGAPERDEFHRNARLSMEAFNARINDPSRENIGDASRRNVRGFAAAQVRVTILLTNYNLRTTAAFIAGRVGADAEKGRVGTTYTIRRRNRERHNPCAESNPAGTSRTTEDGAAPTT
jgi:hypothetical protein